MLRVVTAASVALGLGSVAAPSDFWDQWRLETELGYMHAQGGLEGLFGGGVDAGWTLGHRVGKAVVETGVHFGSVSYEAAQTVIAPVCAPLAAGRSLCEDRPTTQRGRRTSVAFGISLPFALGDGGRTWQVGAGGQVGDLSVDPGGQDLGTRRGAGVYLKLAADLVNIGSAGGAGVLLRGGWSFSHGATLGASSPPGASDVWIEANLALRFGAGSRPQ